jgi:CheY-like chemotaxis protein
VEDNAPNREVVRAYTAACNLRLIEAENGQEALQMLKPESAGTLPAPRPDLILMDIRMPVMDGYEATQVIKADPTLQTIPVVALTAYAVKEQVEQYQDLYDAYLSKPISKLELIATLAEFLPHTKTSLERITHPSPSQEGNKRGMLEELKDYAAHTGTFPQALLDKLQVELLPRHQETCELMSADEMIEFAEAIIAVGDAFMIPPLKKYGEELLRYTKVADVINMKRLLARFPEIVKIISK